ncbi:Uncharacterized protein dnm_003830 [Desulfonema magnum]|uniref:Uncharacterized protein n=1 Tax=Desulfonema magnum TaxID=45655 RepID=A0A975GK55_9BACT|nr:Uncharacterized protein dnm_003830 [Desulfonema magnum]
MDSCFRRNDRKKLDHRNTGTKQQNYHIKKVFYPYLTVLSRSKMIKNACPVVVPIY